MKHSYLLLICLLHFSLANAQEDVAKSLLDSSYQYSRYDKDKCLSFVDSAISSASLESSYISDLGLYYSGICYNRNGEYQEAISDFDKGIEKFSMRKDTSVLSDLYYQKSLAYRQQSDYLNFIENVNLSQALAEEIGYSKTVGMCHNAKLIHYKERSMLEEAEDCGLLALTIFKELKDSSSLGDTYNNLGVLMTALDKPQRALGYHLNQHDINLKKNNVWGMGYSHSKLAACYAKQRNFDKAEKHINEALQITQSIGTPYELAGSFLKGGELFMEMNKFENALTYTHRARSIARQHSQMNVYVDILSTLSDIHKKRGQLDSALYYIQEYLPIKDAVLNTNIGEQLSEIETKYETEKKELEINRLALKTELSDSRIERQLIIIIASLLSIGILFTLFFRVRSKNKKINEQNAIISTALKEKEILLKEIHHRVKNNLQVISSLLSIQSRSISDVKAKEAIQEGRSKVHSMSLIHQNLYQKGNLAGIQMNDYLPKLSRNLFDTYNISGDQIELKTDITKITLDVDTVIPIGLIVNELITNSLKYAFPNEQKGIVEVKLKKDKDQLILEVLDNGIGLDVNELTKKKDSFGHSLIRAFKNKLGAVIKIDSKQGTSIVLSISKFKEVVV